MKINPQLNLVINGRSFSYKFFETLKCVSKTWSQREAARRLGISHAVLNRRIRDAEEILGFKLVEGGGAGSNITFKGYEILEEYEKYSNMVLESEQPIICGGYISAGLLEILLGEYGLESLVYRSDDISALKMAQRNLVDILCLDDPMQAFIRDLDIIPVAYDHLVLVGGEEDDIGDVRDLKGKKFVEIANSVQRLAWNTLDELDIDYTISKVCNSPQTALEIVKQENDLYTFLNNSFIEGNSILAEDTRHLISMIILNQSKSILQDFADFVEGPGQIILKKWGFQRID